jgi:hypothetical protein
MSAKHSKEKVSGHREFSEDIQKSVVSEGGA